MYQATDPLNPGHEWCKHVPWSEGLTFDDLWQGLVTL